MSLYGALFAGVAGLKAQGNKLGIVSDNIANVNTVGYKQGSALFETLVTPNISSTQYAAGGVIGGNRQLVDKQGLLQSTDSPTDIAISGGGFFIVSATDDASSLPLYTRAGSFRQDQLGNLVNAQGFYLYGWPLDREGRLPGSVGNVNTTSSANLDSLRVVNVESGNGVASATTSVEVGANLDAGEDIYTGAGATVDMDIFSANNYNRPSDTIIVSNDYGSATANNIRRGDQFTVTTGAGLSYTYLYGGFTAGRSVLTGAVGDGAFDTTILMEQGGGTSQLTAANGSNVITITTDAAHNLGPVGSTRTIMISGLIAADLAGSGLAPANVNGQRTITVTGANSYTFNATAQATGPSAVTPLNALAAFNDFTGNILDATSATQAFLTNNALSQFSVASRSFTITPSSTGVTATFTYTSASPSAVAGQFNNLNNLATAINEVSGITARVVDGRIYISAEDANASLTFTNGDSVGSGTLGGIDWLQELDITNIAVGTNRFNTQAGLAALVNASSGLDASIENPLSTANTTINVEDPLDTIRFQDYVGTATTLGLDPFTSTAGPGLVTITVAAAGHTFVTGQNVVLANTAAFDNILASELDGAHTITAVVPGVSYSFTITPATAPVGGVPGGGAAATYASTNVGSVLAELGIVDSLNGAAYVQGDTTNLGPQYDASGAVGQNMASGDIVAQFSRNVRVYDALGTGHDLRMSFIKIASNRWAVEVHVVPSTEINGTLVDGQVATGTIEFNGDGSLRSVSAGLISNVTINWTNGSAASEISFGFGTAGQPFGTAGATTIGLTDGLSQFDSSYNLNFINQNGAPVGELVGISFDEDGFVIASYSNGETQRIYKLAIADFNNPNGMRNISGNVFAQTQNSGEVNLREAGRNGVGNVAPSSLESSNVDLSEQLTDMIVAQRAYQANTRVITTTDRLLEELNGLVR